MSRKRSYLSGIAGFVLTALVLTGFYFAAHGEWFDIDSIEIEMDSSGGQEVLFERIRKDLAVTLKPWVGRKAWDVSLEEILELTQADSRVQKASISRRFPNGLVIWLRPRDPVMGLVDPQGLVHPVASDASLLPPLLPQEAPDLPFLRGKDFFSRADLRAKAVHLIEQFPAQGAVSVASVSEVHFAAKEGFSFILVGKGVRVLVGDNGYKTKLGRVEQVLHYLNEHQIDGRVIDARFSKKVVVRLRNQP